MDSNLSNNLTRFLVLVSESPILTCALLVSILTGLTGCAGTDCSYEATYSPISSRVKKCFLFHHDKCSPHPYRSLDGYQSDLDKLVVKHAAKKCAKQSLKTLACNCKEKPSKAFRDGYQQAYIDIALGDSGEVPPVPPEEYWAAHYRTPTGYLQSQEWFTGYKLGAEHALADGRYEYNEVATPYSLADWNQPQSGYWGEDSNYQPLEPEVDTQQNATPPASTDHSQHTPLTPKTILPPAPAHQPDRHTQSIPQRSHPERIQRVPKIPQKQIQPPMPRQQIQKQKPLVAPKPPPQLQLPAPAINRPAINRQSPAIRRPASPTYINDDPPPNPYSLQSYPYTPLPQIQTPPNHRSALNQSSTNHRLLRVPNGRVYGDRSYK